MIGQIFVEPGLSNPKIINKQLENDKTKIIGRNSASYDCKNRPGGERYV